MADAMVSELVFCRAFDVPFPWNWQSGYYTLRLTGRSSTPAQMAAQWAWRVMLIEFLLWLVLLPGLALDVETIPGPTQLAFATAWVSAVVGIQLVRSPWRPLSLIAAGICVVTLIVAAAGIQR